MDVVSLEGQETSPSGVRADVCVVGAGTAGLYLAQRLGEAGQEVVVLEAGPKMAVSPDEAGFDVEFTHDVYRGAIDGRAFGVGGTTARWGGQLIPFRATDATRENVSHGNAWSHVVRMVEKHGAAVSTVLGLRHDDHEASSDRLPAGIASSIAEAGLAAQASRWLPFARRNFWWLVRQNRGRRNRVTIFCDAVVADWRLQPGDRGLVRIAGIEARSASGQRLRVTASRYIIAAGAIESPRILQEIDLIGGGEVIPQSAAVGRCLSDHLSFKVGEVPAGQLEQSAAAFGPFFDKGLMRTWHFVEANPDPAGSRFFAHFVFALDNPGFNLARTALQDLQARRMPGFGFKDLWNGSAGLAQLAWSRGFRSRLFIPKETPVCLQLDMEQRPNSSNSVSLGRTRDRYGRRIACVQWKISSRDRDDMAIAKRNLLSTWCNPIRGLPGVVPLGEADFSSKLHDVYHPVGTCRMGDDAEAVVGWDLKVRGISNLHVLSTAIFPSAGTANPTFGLLCMAEMLAEKLKTGLDG